MTSAARLTSHHNCITRSACCDCSACTALHSDLTLPQVTRCSVKMCSVGSPRLLSFRELPSWMRHNDFIETLYPPPTLTPWGCVRYGFLRFTNESVNVWSHFLGSLFFFGWAVKLCISTGYLASGWVSNPYYAMRAAAENHVVQAEETLRGLAKGTLPVLLMAGLCTGLSCAYHVFWPMSSKALKFWGQLDFVGIACLCAGHAVTAVYYSFYCAPEIAFKYYIGIGTVLLTALNLILSAKFRAKSSRVLRAVTFTALGTSICLPVIHAGYLHSWKLDAFPLFFGWLFSAGVFYLIGATLYATRAPECCRPGKHDRYAASHQLMHFAVIIGAFLHAYGCHLLINYRVAVGCSRSPLL